jgi:hypothetical protein
MTVFSQYWQSPVTPHCANGALLLLVAEPASEGSAESLSVTLIGTKLAGLMVGTSFGPLQESALTVRQK